MDLRAFESTPFDDGGGVESVFFLVFGLTVLLVLCGFAFVGYAALRSARAARRAGIDPFTPPAVLVAQAVRGDGTRTLEQRLAELDDLRARAVISADEHAAARRKALEA